MTQNRRIVLNVIATYGRSLYALVCGLFTWRWVLMALGQTDYGLLGLVGGLVGFVSFLNSILATAVGRFYAYSVGAAQVEKNRDIGLDECRRWFNIALSCHVVLGSVLIVFGYPVGLWAVKSFLTIPADRVSACVWVWRFVCAACFVGMVNVPFQAMYTAKQYIAELTVYSLITTTLNVGVLYYMVSHPSDWLARYSFWTMLTTVVPQVIIAIRAVCVFPECRLVRLYLWDARRFKELIGFCGGRFIGVSGSVLSSQALAIMVNKFLGPIKNGSMTFGRGIMAQTMTLAGALSGAFSPAITAAAGAGDFELMRKYVFRTCTFSSLAVMVFAVPLGMEIDEVLRLWLIKSPEGAGTLCVCLLVREVIERLSEGHWIAILAVGKIARFQLVESFGYVIELGSAIVLVFCGWDLLGIGIALILGRFFALIVKLWYGRSLAGISVVNWLRKTLVPVLLTFVMTALAGCVPRCVLHDSLFRVCATALATFVAFVPMFWFVCIGKSEKEYLLARLRMVFK